MAPIPSKTHNAGALFGWQMRPRGQRRCIACAKQDCFGKQTTWRDWSASCLKGCIYLYKYMCTEHLEWDCREDPPVLGVCLGMWNFLDLLHVRFMFIEPSKWPADQDAWFWFTLQSKGCISSKKLKHHTLLPMSVKYWQVSFQEVWCHEKLRKALLKRIGTFSWKPDQIDLHCNFGTPHASKQQLLHAWSLHVHVLRPKFKREGSLAYDLHLTHDTSIRPVLRSKNVRSFVHMHVHGPCWIPKESFTEGNVPKVNLRNLPRVAWSVSRTFGAASRESWSK